MLRFCDKPITMLRRRDLFWWCVWVRISTGYLWFFRSILLLEESLLFLCSCGHSLESIWKLSEHSNENRNWKPCKMSCWPFELFVLSSYQQRPGSVPTFESTSSGWSFKPCSYSSFHRLLWGGKILFFHFTTRQIVLPSSKWEGSGYLLLLHTCFLSKGELNIAKMQKSGRFLDFVFFSLPLSLFLWSCGQMKKIFQVFQVVKNPSRRKRSRNKAEYGVHEELETQEYCNHQIVLCSLHLCVKGKTKIWKKIIVYWRLR